VNATQQTNRSRPIDIVAATISPVLMYIKLAAANMPIVNVAGVMRTLITTHQNKNHSPNAAAKTMAAVIRRRKENISGKTFVVFRLTDRVGKA
jgi:hypothetical protein